MSATEFHEFIDDYDEIFDASSPLPKLDGSRQPYNLNGVPHDPKAPLSPPGGGFGAAGASPESLNDSSSDSVSSKRTASSSSDKTALTAGDVMMTDGPPAVKPEWNPSAFISLGDDDNVYMFQGNPDGLHDGFDADKFMEESFDFDSASSSPNAAVTAPGALSMDSPEMPTIQTSTPQRSSSGGSILDVGSARAPHPASVGRHHKHYSQYSLTQSMNGLKTSGSREVSPMSNLMNPSHETSPSAFFTNSPSPSAPEDHASAMSGMNGNRNGFWQPKLDLASQSVPHGLPMPPQYPGDGFGAMAQIPIFGQQPPINFSGHYQLTIHPTPSKSRVETQIPIKMTLCPIPPGIKRLHLPPHTISKPKLLAKPPAERSPDMLELQTMLVCTSAMQGEGRLEKAFARAAAPGHSPRASASSPEDEDDEHRPQNGGEVHICAGCITRERKRAARKKIKKVEEEEMWSRDESRRVIVFNTQEIKEWQPPSGIVTDSTITGRPEPVVPTGALQVDAPMRIACYCRHHGEKMGFQVIFTIKDWQNRVVAQAISQNIMITDDHKTHPIPTQLAAPSDMAGNPTIPPTLDSGAVAAGAPFRLSHSSSDLQNLQQSVSPPFATTPILQAHSPPLHAGLGTVAGGNISVARPLSRPASPTSHSGPQTKKRKASGTRLPIGMTMTRLDTTTSPPASGAQMSAGPSAATSPFTPSLNSFQGPDAHFVHNGPPIVGLPQSFATGPPTPNGNDGMLSQANRSTSVDNLPRSMVSAPTSAHPSRAPSPNGLRNSIQNMPQTQFAQALATSLYSLPVGMSQTRAQPIIHKIIPNEGPKSGGIEVTILGASFYQGLEVLFGDQRATTTTYWGESSLVCLLPPSPVSGPVYVTFKQQQVQPAQSFQSISKQQPIFKYVDDDEEKLMRTALSVLGQKMSGKMVDVKELARRIIGEGDPTWGGAMGQQSSGSGYGGGNTFNMSVESQLLKLLELIDLDDSPRISRLDLRRSTGQTMLHLACSLGFHRFVAGLLARGANPDLRDRGGLTPMHLAALNNHSEIVRRLIQVGADPTIRSLSGIVPADLARSRTVLRAIRHFERRIRSRSGGSLHSRASSAASLRSLWDPLGVSDDSQSIDDGEESPEYSSGDFESSDQEEESWLDMRRRSTHSFGRDADRADLLPGESDTLPAGLGSPTFATVRDQFTAQFQHWQQAMAIHMPNFPQLPNLSGMPMLPDYQAYLQAAPFMRRVTSLVPGMSGSRPGSSGDENAKAMDNRWWDLSSYITNSAAPPPAYSEIFPQADFDKKQASAAQAAAEAEADIKCATLYDDVQVTEVVEVEASRTKTAVPSVLKIGRKSAITREQQQDFLRVHEANFKGIRSDMNLWCIWIPLLICIMAAMLYGRFPEYFATAWSMVSTRVQGFTPEVVRNMPDRVVEVV